MDEKEIERTQLERQLFFENRKSCVALVKQRTISWQWFTESGLRLGQFVPFNLSGRQGTCPFLDPGKTAMAKSHVVPPAA